jgi:hypothetical protein
MLRRDTAKRRWAGVVGVVGTKHEEGREESDASQVGERERAMFREAR